MEGCCRRRRRCFTMLLLSRTWIVLAAIIISKVAALDMRIKEVVCDSRPVQVTFDYICNGDYLCTFGEIESMEGACTSDTYTLHTQWRQQV